jgi:hypothetical protein
MLKRAHLVTGGFPPGAPAGHDHDYARLRLLTLLAEQDVPASVGNDFGDVAKWLPLSRLLVTYVAGPYPDAAQSAAIQSWLEAGEHPAVLGSFFLTHPPLCKFRVDVKADHPITEGIGAAFEVEDEPYFIELQRPQETQILLTADYGSNGTWPVTEALYGKDSSLQADGKTRVLGYTRPVGAGAVTYFAFGHCTNPPVYRGPWENPAFTQLLRNAIGFATATPG